MRWIAGVVVAVVATAGLASPAGAGKPNSSVQFVSATDTVSEASTQVSVALQRTGKGKANVTVTSAGGTATGGSACATGVDYVTTGAGGVKVTLTNDGGTSVRIALCPDGDDEADETIVLALTHPSNGTVVGANGTTTVTITDDDGSATCVDDAVSDDSPGTAFPMGVQLLQRVSCPGNSDWFSLPSRVADLNLTKHAGDVRVTIYDETFTPIAALDWNQDTAHLQFPPGGGPLYLEAVAARGTGGAYTLQASYSMYLPTTG